MPEIIPNWHPIFVHFAVALLSLAVLLHLVAHFSSGLIQDESRIVARWLLWLGALAALATGATGIIAFNTVTHDDPSHLAMIDHRNWALPTIGLFVLLAIWSFLQAWKSKSLGKPFLVLLVVAGGLLASTAWHGGELVYRHGLGVMSLPNADAHAHGDGGHAHDEAGGHGHESLDGGEHHQDVLGSGGGMSDMSMDEGVGDKAAPAGHQHDDGHDHQH